MNNLNLIDLILTALLLAIDAEQSKLFDSIAEQQRVKGRRE